MSRESRRPSNPIHGETATLWLSGAESKLVHRLRLQRIAGEPWNTEDGGNTDFRAPFVGYSPNAAFFKTVGTPPMMALKPTWRSGSRITSSPAPAIPSATPMTSRAISASSSPETTRTTCATPMRGRTSIAPTSSARTSWCASKCGRPHSILSYFTNDWNLTGIGILQNGRAVFVV